MKCLPLEVKQTSSPCDQPFLNPLAFDVRCFLICDLPPARPFAGALHFYAADNNLGTAFMQKAQENEAAVHFPKALGIQPDRAEPHCHPGFATDFTFSDTPPFGQE
jgi:hypothetical protein